MAQINSSNRDSFGSKLGIIAAAAGSAIGLGNIWRFPYVAGENGGGAFLLVYILFIIVIGIPVMLSELTIGRRAQLNAFGSFKKLAPKTAWPGVGIMGIVAAFVILSFYSTVAGWTLQYLYIAVTDGFSGKTGADLSNYFNDFSTSGLHPVILQMIFMVLTGWIVYSGVKNGIEKYTKILMPVLLVIIIVLCIRSITLPGAGAGLNFLFKPDFSKLNADVILEALGQAFFSLSIGMGTLITYGSYIKKNDNLANTAVQVTAADTFIAILAGVAIFPAVFAFGIQPDAGEGLTFITLPLIFEQMAGGYFFSLIFFMLLTIAALTSTISVLEVVVAFYSEELKTSRKKATIISAAAISVLGVFCTLSQGPLSGLQIGGLNLFSLMENAAAIIFLPVGGMFIVLFVAWYMKGKDVRDELTNGGSFKMILYPVYNFIIKFLAPIAIAFVILDGFGVLEYIF